MSVDLSDCNITYEMDQDIDTLRDDTTERMNPHLTKEKRLVVLEAENAEAYSDSLSNSYFQLVFITRIKFHLDKDIWMVPLLSLVGTCFAVCNKTILYKIY